MALWAPLKNPWFIRTSLALVLVLSWLGIQGSLNSFQSQARQPRTLAFQWPLAPEVLEKAGLQNLGSEAVDRVSASGFFNDWDPDDRTHLLRQVRPDRWEISLPLEPGDNQYKFVVYFKDYPQGIWTHDLANPDKVSDSFGGWNSVLRIPDWGPWLDALGILWAGMAGILVVYTLLDTLLAWVLRWKLAFRFKLVLGLSVLVLGSNAVFLYYNVEAQKETIKLSVIEGVNYLYGHLAAEGLKFQDLGEEEFTERVSYLMDRAFGRLRTRVEPNKLSNNQVSISTLGVLDSQGHLVHLALRRENASQKNLRASAAGYDTPEELYEHEVIPPLLLKRRMDPRTVVTWGSYSPSLAKLETPQTQDALNWLGFNTFLLPISEKARVVGYFIGDIQVKLFAGEVSRVFFFNLYLVGIGLILSVLLLLRVGRRVTLQLRTLTDWTQEIIDGDYSQERRIASRDELQQLGENFNKMRLGLKESFEIIEKQNQWLKAEAFTDRMTGLKNRKKLLADMLVPGRRSLVLLNLDSFKEINDFFSSEVGDFLLVEVGQRLKAQSELLGDQVYKVGSDEFVVLREEYLVDGDLETLAQSYADVLMAHSYLYQENSIYLAVTCGASSTDAEIIPGVTYQASRLLAQADMALKKAKRSQGRIVCYHPSMEGSREYARNVIWTNKLRTALSQDRIVPFFQLIRPNAPDLPVKYECLVRMVESDGTVIAPGHFLRLSQKSRYYRFITQVMLDKSMAAFKDSEAEFALNLSIKDILDPKTMAYLFDRLKAFPDTAQRMVFEIVETDGIDNYDSMRDFIDKIRPFGCKVAIDDFGSGYSSFEHILQLKVDYIKIDGTLIKNLDQDPSAQSVTRAIAKFAQELGIKTIAEFVHSEEVQEKIKEYGIPYSQGYLFGEPKPKI